MPVKLKSKAVTVLEREQNTIIPGLTNFGNGLNDSATLDYNGNFKPPKKFAISEIEIGNNGLPVKRDAKGRITKGSATIANAGRKRKDSPEVTRQAIMERTNYFHRKVMEAFMQQNENGETILNHLIRTRQADAMALVEKITPDGSQLMDLRQAALPSQNNASGDTGTAIVVTLNHNVPTKNNAIDV